MIEQQYYTRERGGLFGNNDGYDSIAKSGGLSLDFIKKNLHPICQYDVSNVLQKAGETDETKYPSQFMIMALPGENMLVGQAAYKSKDFTGLRSTFFMHNYILSEKEKIAFIKNPVQLFGIGHFAQHYDIRLGKELPSLNSLPFSEENPLFQDRETLFNLLGLTVPLFQKILYATYVAINSKKKVYICLDVPLEKLNEYAKALLYHLYKQLPYILLKDLGVSTYSRGIEAKKNLHIMFVEKGSLRTGDSKVEKEFVFDFENQRFLNVDNEAESNAYFRFAMKYAKSTKALELFNDFLEKVTEGIAPIDAKSLEVHNKLALLFEIELYGSRGEEYNFMQPADRQGLLSALLGYTQRVIDEETKERLYGIIDYTIRLLIRDIEQGHLLEEEDIKVILKFKYRIKPNLPELLYNLLYDIKEALKRKDEKHIKMVLDGAGKEEAVYTKLFSLMYEEKELRNNVCYKVVEGTLLQCNTLEKLIKATNRLSIVEAILCNDSYYKKIISEYFKVCLGAEPDKIKMLKCIQNWCEPKNLSLYEELLYQGEAHAVEGLNLDTLTSEEALMAIDFKYTHKKLSYDVIETYKSLKNRNVLLDEGKQSLEIAKKLIMKFYKTNLKKENFYMLEYVFSQSSRSKNGKQEMNMNFQDMYTYLYGIGIDELLEFIIWAKDERMYSLQDDFDKQVITFFKTLKQKEGKIPKEVLKQRLEAPTRTKRLYIKLKGELQPKWVRVIKRNQKLIFGSSAVVFLTITVGAGGYALYSKLNGPSDIPLPTAEEAKEMLVKQGMFFIGEDIEATLDEFMKEK